MVSSWPRWADFITRKIVYVLLLVSVVLGAAVAHAFSWVFRCRGGGSEVRSIAAVWYLPPDFPSASKTRLGVWTSRFEAVGVRFNNFSVNSMAEARTQYESGVKTLRYWFILKSFWRRLLQLFALRGYDVVWIDRGLVPQYPFRQATFEKCVRRMARYLVVDTSDGTDYSGNPRLVLDTMALADKITVAYAGLYDFYSARFPRVERFEYPIQQEPYIVRRTHSAPTTFTLGWMGSHYNFRYLKDIEPELRRVAKTNPFRMVVICRQDVDLDIPGAHVETHRYGEDYYRLLATFDIGLVPFTVDDFGTRGKIGMKHQEFLLIAVPQVASPVGISEHAVDGEHLLIARGISDWADRILQLMADEALRSRLGTNGRKLCLDYYSVESQWPAVRHALTAF